LEKKIEFGREMALSTQQNEFLLKRIDEFQKQNETFLAHYEEKLSKKIINFLYKFLLKRESKSRTTTRFSREIREAK